MQIHDTNAKVVRGVLVDVIKMLEMEHPGDFPAHLKGLYTSLYLMEGLTYPDAVQKAEHMAEGS